MLRKRRSELDISQEELAARAELHRTYVADIERGTRNVSLVNLETLAGHLGYRWLGCLGITGSRLGRVFTPEYPNPTAFSARVPVPVRHCTAQPEPRRSRRAHGVECVRNRRIHVNEMRFNRV